MEISGFSEFVRLEFLYENETERRLFENLSRSMELGKFRIYPEIKLTSGSFRDTGISNIRSQILDRLKKKPTKDEIKIYLQQLKTQISFSISSSKNW